MNKIIISIEGNIGAGKSTLLKLLNDRYGDRIETMQEPVESWRNYIIAETGERINILDMFYSNPKKYAYLFQTIVFKTFTENLLSKFYGSDKCIFIIERSLSSALKVFCEMLYESDNLTNIEFDCLRDLRRLINTQIIMPLCVTRKYIYLRVTPEICMSRIQNRNRPEEATMTMDYLEKIHEKHEVWLSEESNVHVIDGDEDYIGNDNKTIDIINDILNFIV